MSYTLTLLGATLLRRSAPSYCAGAALRLWRMMGAVHAYWGLNRTRKERDPPPSPLWLATLRRFPSRRHIWFVNFGTGYSERGKGWVHFDKNYPLTDRNAIQACLKKLLEKDPVYRYIYGGSRR